MWKIEKLVNFHLNIVNTMITNALLTLNYNDKIDNRQKR